MYLYNDPNANCLIISIAFVLFFVVMYRRGIREERKQQQEFQKHQPK